MGDYHQITLTEWSEMKDRLRRELNDLRTSFVRVGYILRKMEDSKAYEAEGYKSVAEFALKEHGLKPSTTSRWMAINREYSIDGYSEQLDPRYLDMNASQLTEMLTLEQKDRELITPETPRAEIRELKRFNAEAAAAGDVPDRGEKTPAEKAFENLLATDQQTAAAVRSCVESGLTDSKHLFEAVAPSGSRMFRSGTVFLVFNALNIMVKVFGRESESVSYEDFETVAVNWFEEHGKPEKEAPHEAPAAEPEESEPAEDAAETPAGEPEPEEPETAEDAAETPAGEPEPEEPETAEDAAETPAGEPEPEEPARKEPAKKETTKNAQDKKGSRTEKQTPVVDMNQPETVAPAQKSKEVIVDEAGNPAPEDPEEIERKRLEEVEKHRSAVEMHKAVLNSEINTMDWPSARESAEMLLEDLIFLQENDYEAIDALVRRTLHGGE